MGTRSAALKAVTSHVTIDGLQIHANNSQDCLQENQKIIKEPEIVQKNSAQKKFNLNRQ